LRTFYRQKGVLQVGERVRAYQTKLGLQPTTVRGLDLKYSCVFCTPQGKLNFHWKCIMEPWTVLPYIVMCERAHMRQPNHTAALQNAVDKVLPDYRQRKAWLRVHGAGMDL
jgi:predicted metal-dependent hydrolase